MRDVESQKSDKEPAGYIDQTLLDGGAERIGTSSGEQIINELKAGRE